MTTVTRKITAKTETPVVYMERLSGWCMILLPHRNFDRLQGLNKRRSLRKVLVVKDDGQVVRGRWLRP